MRSKGRQKGQSFRADVAKNMRKRGRNGDIAKVELEQGTCPKGHRLPNKTNRGQCTPLYCAGHTNQPDSEGNLPKNRFLAIGKLGHEEKKRRSEALKLISQEADAHIDSMIPPTVPGYEQARQVAKAQKGEELLKLATAIGRHAAARAYFKIPEGLKGQAAEEFVQQRAMELSVDAIADLERDLKLGDDAQRREARRDILDMTGQRRKEVAGNSQPVIMLVNPGGAQALPWMQRVERKPEDKQKAIDAAIAGVASAEK